MGKYKALIITVDDPGEMTPEKGDIMKIAPLSHQFGTKEGPPRYREVILDEKDFFNIENLVMPLKRGRLENLPAAVRINVKMAMQMAPYTKPKTIKYRRYKLSDTDQLEDKGSARNN